VLIVQAVKFEGGTVDVASKTEMLAMALMLDARNVTTMGFSEISKLLLVNPTNIARKEVGERFVDG
jgi:hypothetical protein